MARRTLKAVTLVVRSVTLSMLLSLSFVVRPLGHAQGAVARTSDGPRLTIPAGATRVEERGLSRALADDIGPVAPLGYNFPIAQDKGKENQGKPGVAFDGTNFLTVWCDLTTYSIYAARVSWDGTVLDPDSIPILTHGSQLRQPSVGFDGTNYLVVWEDKRTGAGEEYGARVTPSGEVLDPGGVQLTEGANALIRMPALAFDGERFLLVWRTAGTSIRAARISTAGGPPTNLDPANGFVVASAGQSKYPAVAFDGTSFMAVWENYRSGVTNGIDIYGARITPDGTVLDPDGFVICDAAMNQRWATIGFDGSQYQVAWYDFRPDGSDIHGSAYGARVTPEGVVLDETAYMVADRARGQIPVQVNCGGTACLAAWSVDHGAAVDDRLIDVYARRLSPDGGVLDAVGIPVATAYGNQFAPVIGYGSGRYLVAWGESLGRAIDSAVYGQMLEEQTLGARSLSPQPVKLEHLTSRSLTAAESAVWEKQILPDAEAYITGGMAASAERAFAYGKGVYSYTLGSWAWSYGWENTYGGFLYAGDDAWTGGWCRSYHHFDGIQWSHEGCHSSNATYDIVTGLWGTGYRNLFASCDSGDIMWYDGFWDWTPVNMGVSSDLWDITGFGEDDIYVVGNWGRAFHFDGESWAPLPGAPTVQSLNALWGTGGTDLFVVGDFGTILHYDGIEWELMESGTVAHLFGVWGASSSDVYAVGFGGTILHYDGVSWQAEPSGTTQDLIGVWGVRDLDAGDQVIWAGGRGSLVLEKAIPIVGFKGEPEYGTAPLDVDFINETELAHSSCSWDFGDGNTSTSAAPTHRYGGVGNYTVTLTLGRPEGDLTLVRPSYIRVEEPIEGLHATHDGPTPAGETTTFRAWVDAGTNVAYLWDLDLLTDDGPVVTRAYPEPKFHYIWVTATNSVSAESQRLGVWILPAMEHEVLLPVIVRSR